jgi:hypothetical protein
MRHKLIMNVLLRMQGKNCKEIGSIRINTVRISYRALISTKSGWDLMNTLYMKLTQIFILIQTLKYLNLRQILPLLFQYGTECTYSILK